jgi:carbonic anhydrase
MEAILDPKKLERLPYVRRWLRSAERVREIIDTRYGHLTHEERVSAAVLENVLVQLENLRAFPFVAERLGKGTLAIRGWCYEIATGRVHHYDPELEEFVPFVADGRSSQFPKPLEGT